MYVKWINAVQCLQDHNFGIFDNWELSHTGTCLSVCEVHISIVKCNKYFAWAIYKCISYFLKWQTQLSLWSLLYFACDPQSVSWLFLCISSLWSFYVVCVSVKVKVPKCSKPPCTLDIPSPRPEVWHTISTCQLRLVQTNAGGEVGALLAWWG